MFRSSKEFELSIGYKDVRCSVQRDTTGGYTADVIIQHHDVVITSLDVGMYVLINIYGKLLHKIEKYSKL